MLQILRITFVLTLSLLSNQVVGQTAAYDEFASNIFDESESDIFDESDSDIFDETGSDTYKEPVSDTSHSNAARQPPAKIPQSPRFGEVNMGKIDRSIRFVVGVALLASGSNVVFKKNSTWGYIPMGASIIPFFSAATGICPIYYIFNFDTRKEKEKSKFSFLLLPGRTLAASYNLQF